jgi:diguanylate cyclase (GGDEF)-like protein
MLTADHYKIDDLNKLAHSLRESDPRHGLETAQNAYAMAQTLNYPEGMVTALVNLSHCHNWLSHFSLALAQALDALKLMYTLPAYSHKADLYLVISRSYLHLAIFDEAAVWGQFAQQQAHDDQNHEVEADAFNTMGINYYRLEQHNRALEMYEQALTLHRVLGSQRGICKAFINTAEALSKLERHERALECAHEALRFARESGVRLLEAYALHTIGQMYANKGDYEEALGPLEGSIPVARENGNQYVPLVSTIAIGQVHAHWGHPETAITYFNQGLALAEELGNKLYTYRCHEALAQCFERLSDWRQSLEHYKQFHAVKEIVFNEQNMTRVQGLEIMHQVETARKETEFYQTRNADLEQEIIRRVELEKELQRQASTDALTKIANRRHFIETAGAEIERAIRHKRPLALALIDLDHFKQINDTCGHAVGDQALLTLTRIFQENIRPTDLFARFGGDEFVLLLLETVGTQAYEVLERIRRLLTGQVIETESVSVSISISAGIAVLRNNSDTLDILIARADQGLYEMKRAGRNSIYLVEDP